MLAEEFWADDAPQVLTALGPLLDDLSAESLRTAPTLEIATATLTDGAVALKVLHSLQVAQGWAIMLSPAGSAVEIVFEQEAFANGYNHVAEAELLLNNGSSVKIGQGGSGVLSVAAYGPNAAGILHKVLPDSPISSSRLDGLLMQSSRLRAQRKDIGCLVYTVYWQATRDFGMRQRLAVFAGFEAEASK